MSATGERPARAGDVLLKAAEYLKTKGRESPRLGAEVLLAETLGCDRLGVYLRFEQVLSPAELDRYRDLIRRRGQGEPVAYLIGKKEFHSLRFVVTPAVLIPRPETETLVEVAVDSIRKRNLAAPRILDLGTGPGNILISVAKELGEGIYVAVERSKEALEVARRNVETLLPGTRVALYEGDWFAGLPPGEEPFDAILANPPYIPSAELDRLPPEISVYEPRIALDGGPDGLDAYRVIARDSGRHLRRGGFIAVEIGAAQHASVGALLEEHGYRPQVRRDLAGKERVIFAEKGG